VLELQLRLPEVHQPESPSHGSTDAEMIAGAAVAAQQALNSAYRVFLVVLFTLRLCPENSRDACLQVAHGHSMRLNQCQHHSIITAGSSFLTNPSR
ncbi:4526_t:CDS:2, partial [Acaulospora colombiana]